MKHSPQQDVARRQSEEVASIAVLGVLLRVDVSAREQVERELNSIDGVTTFELDDALRLGVVIERDAMDDAEEVLHQRVAGAPGVLGAWPVFAHAEDDDSQNDSTAEIRRSLSAS